MDTKTIQKNYDKLTAKERFSLLNAAIKRGDRNESSALQASAPKKGWSIPTTRGLVEAFEFLAMWHVMTMQELDSLYWLLLAVGDDEGVIKGAPEDGYLFLMDKVQSGAQARDMAWRSVCKEYSIDPDEAIQGYPGVMSINLLVESLKRFNDINPVKIDPGKYIDELHAVIEQYRKQWE